MINKVSGVVVAYLLVGFTNNAIARQILISANKNVMRTRTVKDMLVMPASRLVR